MRQAHVDQTVGDRLRFVFQDAVVSYSVFGVVTFGEVAQAMSELSRRRRRAPVAVDLTMGSRGRTTNAERGTRAG